MSGDDNGDGDGECGIDEEEEHDEESREDEDEIEESDDSDDIGDGGDPLPNEVDDQLAIEEVS